MESRKKIIFLGDSITDAGHDLQMAPEGQSRLGDGYVSRIAAMLGVDEVDTADREGPDMVSILVGCNDAAVCMNTGRTLDETGFAEGYRKLLRRIREGTRARIVCMGPFIFPWPLEYRNWIPLIREIEEVERAAATEAGALFIPLHDLLSREAGIAGYDRITVDGVHLTGRGAELIAREWLRRTEFRKKDR